MVCANFYYDNKKENKGVGISKHRAKSLRSMLYFLPVFASQNLTQEKREYEKKIPGK